MTIRILLVDDHPIVRQGLKTLLEGHSGWEVIGEASDGAEAVEWYRRHWSGLQMVLLDLTMPVMTGTQAAPILKQTIPNVKIILFTLHADGNKGLAATAGVDLALSKADSIKKLGEHLKALLAPKTA